MEQSPGEVGTERVEGVEASEIVTLFGFDGTPIYNIGDLKDKVNANALKLGFRTNFTLKDKMFSKNGHIKSRLHCHRYFNTTKQGSDVKPCPFRLEYTKKHTDDCYHLERFNQEHNHELVMENLKRGRKKPASAS